MKQLLLCIRTVTIGGVPLATKQKMYAYRDSSTCACGRKMVAVEGVVHRGKHPCFPGDSWLPSECFVPMNDPKLDEKPEHYGTPMPLEKHPKDATVH